MTYKVKETENYIAFEVEAQFPAKIIVEKELLECGRHNAACIIRTPDGSYRKDYKMAHSMVRNYEEIVEFMYILTQESYRL